MTHTGSRGRRGLAFSLTEVVLALGLLSLALIPIFSLLPLALHAAADGKNETRAALLAMSMLSELKNGAGNVRTLRLSDNPDPAQNITVDLSKSSAETARVAYDSEGNALHALTEASYSSGIPGAFFIGTVVKTKTSAETPSLVRLILHVEWPASAPHTSRKQQTFITELNPHS